MFKPCLVLIIIPPCLFCSVYKLSLERIAEEAGPAGRGFLTFVFRGGSTILYPTPDMQNIDSSHGKVSSPVMDFFCAIFQDCMPPDVLLCNSLLATGLHNLICNTSDANALQNFYVMSSGFRHLEGSTIMVPIVQGQHWSLAVLSEQFFLKFDSNGRDSFHGTAELHKALGKLWCMALGHEEGSPMWVNATDLKSWIRVRAPQQEDDWSCGYFVMCYIVLYLTFIEDDKFMDWGVEVRPCLSFLCPLIHICLAILVMAAPLGHVTVPYNEI